MSPETVENNELLPVTARRSMFLYAPCKGSAKEDEEYLTCNGGNMVLITARARKELKRMGCSGTNFLRISRKPGHGGKCAVFIDSTFEPVDEVIQDGEIKIVADLGSASLVRDVAIDYDSSGLTVK